MSPSFALKTNAEIVKDYHFTEEDLVKIKRILLTQGGYDPTTAVGPPPLPLSDDPNATKTLLMYGNGHTEEVFSESIDDSWPVKEVSELVISVKKT